MAQHDYDIANGTGAAVRTDINNVLDAVVSNNSGSNSPGTTFSYQQWADTTAGLLKIRNGANNAWVTVGTLDAANLGLAKLASPALTGNPTAPTASTGDNDTSIATTAFVKTAIDTSENTPPSIQSFTSNGTYSKTSGMVGAKVTILGAGGGGASVNTQTNGTSGGGGGSGATSIKYYTKAQLNSTESVAIGASGAGGAANGNQNAGGTGGSSTFKSITVEGGKGGRPSGASGNGDSSLGAATSTGGDVNIQGGSPSYAVQTYSSQTVGTGANGAASSFGGMGSGGRNGPGRNAAPNSGGGGGGAGGYNTNKAGGNGAAGICIIEEFF